MPDPDAQPFDRRQPFLAHRLKERYEFLRVLGQGGSGVVYEVRNLRLERPEALKVLGESLDREAAERFQHEAQVTASLNHPRIVKVHDCGEEEGIFWFSMDLVDGPTLAGLLAGHGPLPPAAVAQALIPILDALEQSHSLGVIHRDLKPANILLNGEGRPHLTDFGIAKSREGLLKTRTGQFLGTPAYIAPEQATGADTDARADLYAVGAMLYHLLTGRMPFDGESALQMVVARLDREPTPILELRPDLPPALVTVVETAMARDRDRRYPTAAHMREALREACVAGGIPWEGPVTGFPLPPCPRLPLPASPFAPEAPLRRPRWPWILAAAGVLAATALGLAWRSRAAAVAVALAPVSQAPGRTPTPAPAPTPVQAPRHPAQAAAPRPAPEAPAAPAMPVTYPRLEQSFPPEGVPGRDCAGARVILTLLVAEDGSVQTARVLSGAAPACAEAARKASLRYRFAPARNAEGRPMKAATTIAVEFPEGS